VQYTAILNIYLQKGVNTAADGTAPSYVYNWHHYLLQSGWTNYDYADTIESSMPPAAASAFPDVTTGQWVSVDFDLSLLDPDGWMTIRLYNARVDYIELKLTPDTTPPTIIGVSVEPTIVEIGDYLTITATVTDDVGVVAVSADFSYNPEYTDRPSPTSVRMDNVGDDTYEVEYLVPSYWRLGDMIIKVAARDAENWIRSVESVTVTVVVPIEATVDIRPDTLNLKSNGRYVTAFITPPEGYGVGDIDVTTVALEHFTLYALWGEVQDEVFMVKFDRAALVEYLGDQDLVEGYGGKFYDVTLTVTGTLTDGMPFAGTDSIKVIKK